MRAAREHGINFLDDARYNDETGSAPIPTGYSEVLFGELFRAAGWDRDDTIVSNKLWWEFWPDQNADEELAGQSAGHAPTVGVEDLERRVGDRRTDRDPCEPGLDPLDR